MVYGFFKYLPLESRNVDKKWLKLTLTNSKKSDIIAYRSFTIHLQQSQFNHSLSYNAKYNN